MKNRGLFNLVSLGLVVVALVLWFSFSPVTLENTEHSLSYLKLTFGAKDPILNRVELIKFSFLNLIPLILMFVVVLVLALGVLSPKSLKDNMLKLIVLVGSFVAGVMLFLVVPFSVPVIEGGLDSYKLNLMGFVAPVLMFASGIVQVIKK